MIVIRRRSRAERAVGVFLTILAIIVGIVLARQVIRHYYAPLARTAQSPEDAPLDTP